MRLGRYELGRTLGEGNFGKVKFAQDLDSGLPFAVKILEKNRIIHLKITDQVFPSFILLFYFFFFFKKKTTTTILLILFSFSWFLSLGCLFTSYGLCLPAACCLQIMIIISIDSAFFFIWVSFYSLFTWFFFQVYFDCNLTWVLLNLDSFMIL